MLNSNLIPKWRQKRLLRTTKRNGHDYPKRANVTFRRDSDCDIDEEAVEVNDIIETMPSPAIFRTKWSKNLTDKVTEDMTDEEKLTIFLADFLRIKAETAICDKGSSDVLNLIASFMPTGFKCPRTIEGCRSFVRNKVPDVAAIYDEAEEVLVDEARILLMPFNKTVKHVVKKNLEFLLPQTNENGIIDINLQLHTDGVEITKSSKLKIWPLSAVIENLPGKIRISKSNVIIIAIHLSDKTPDFKAFCERFVRDFNSGIQVLFHKVNDDRLQTRTVKYRVRCNMLTGDIPAIRSILNLQGHACQYGCIHCYCESVTARSVFGNGNKRTYVSSETFALRTNDSYKQDLNEMTMRGLQASFGVKGMSYLADLIKVPENVAIDYFHTVLLGPFKEDILRIVNGYMSLNKENGVVKTVKVPGFIERQFSHLKQAIEMSIFPSEFKRKLKPLTELDSYKGIEWKNLMLYALPTVMSDICNGTSKPLYLVILSLANAVIVLMKDNVNAMEIKKSQEQLYQWFTDRTAILDNDAMTLKAHQITHLAEIVERHGSLCHYSCFFGEGLGYNLTRMISLKTLDKSLNQLKTRLTDYSVINSIIDQMEKKVPRESKSIETRMSVRDFCHLHFVDSSLEVQEISEFHFKSYLIKPAYDMPFTKDSFVAYKSDQSNFKCAIGVVKSVVSVDTKIWTILKPLKIKSTIFDKFPVNSNDIILDRIKENTMFDHYFCLEEYMPKEEMTAYRPMSYFAKEKSHLVVIDVNAILYKCLIINTPGEKSICCPIIAPFEHN